MNIEVQHCIDCHLHNWCSRHNEAKYHELYQKLESKVKSLFPKAQIFKNQIPQYYQPKNTASPAIQGTHHYFDSQKNEDTVFPRHGAFQIKVNGFPIFSKLQSNLWPNLQKIISTLTQIQAQLQAGRAINKFSLDYKPESFKEEEKIVEAYKKVIKFKIAKRPHSGFNATAYFPKGSVENSPEVKPTQLKRKNRLSMKKGELHRKSDVVKKPLIRFRNSKAQVANLYCQFQQPKENDDCQFPQIGRSSKNDYASPASKKKIHFKNQTYPMKAQPFQILSNGNSSCLKLEKKASKKLFIKTNEKKAQNSSHFYGKTDENFDDPMNVSDNVFISQNPVFVTNYSTKKSLKSVMSIGDRLESGDENKKNEKHENEIKVQDYTQKRIQMVRRDERKEQNNRFESLSSRRNKKSKLANQYEVFQDQNFPQETKQVQQTYNKTPYQQPTNYQHKLASKSSTTPKKQQIIPQQEFQPHKQSVNKQAQKLQERYEEQLYDNYEIEEKQEIRPGTSSSRRIRNDKQLERQEQVLEYEKVIEGNFKKKGNMTIEHMKEEIYQEVFPAEEVEEAPVIVTQRSEKVQSEIQNKNTTNHKISIEKQTQFLEDKPSIPKQREIFDELEEQQSHQPVKHDNLKDQRRQSVKKIEEIKHSPLQESNQKQQNEENKKTNRPQSAQLQPIQSSQVQKQPLIEVQQEYLKKELIQDSQGSEENIAAQVPPPEEEQLTQSQDLKQKAIKYQTVLYCRQLYHQIEILNQQKQEVKSKPLQSINQSNQVQTQKELLQEEIGLQSIPLQHQKDEKQKELAVQQPSAFQESNNLDQQVKSQKSCQNEAETNLEVKQQKEKSKEEKEIESLQVNSYQNQHQQIQKQEEVELHQPPLKESIQEIKNQQKQLTQQPNNEKSHEQKQVQQDPKCMASQKVLKQQEQQKPLHQGKERCREPEAIQMKKEATNLQQEANVENVIQNPSEVCKEESKKDQVPITVQETNKQCETRHFEEQSNHKNEQKLQESGEKQQKRTQEIIVSQQAPLKQEKLVEVKEEDANQQIPSQQLQIHQQKSGKEQEHAPVQQKLSNKQQSAIEQQLSQKQESKKALEQHVQRQVPLTSIHKMSQHQIKDPETVKSIPNGSQSSIGLTSQVHSELNYVYDEIQARIDGIEEEV